MNRLRMAAAQASLNHSMWQYKILCNGLTIMCGTPNIVAVVFSKLVGVGDTPDEHEKYVATVGASLKGQAMVSGDRVELWVYSDMVRFAVLGEPLREGFKAVDEQTLFSSWLAQVAQQAGVDEFAADERLLEDFRRGTSPGEALLADRLRQEALEG